MGLCKQEKEFQDLKVVMRLGAAASVEWHAVSTSTSKNAGSPVSEDLSAIQDLSLIVFLICPCIVWSLLAETAGPAETSRPKPESPQPDCFSGCHNHTYRGGRHQDHRRLQRHPKKYSRLVEMAIRKSGTPLVVCPLAEQPQPSSPRRKIQQRSSL